MKACPQCGRTMERVFNRRIQYAAGETTTVNIGSSKHSTYECECGHSEAVEAEEGDDDEDDDCEDCGL